jgi:hypothetical protein
VADPSADQRRLLIIPIIERIIYLIGQGGGEDKLPALNADGKRFFDGSMFEDKIRT